MSEFDKVWDKTEGLEGYKSDFPKEVFQYVNSGIALDLGCGEGSIAHYLMQKKFDVYAMDISKAGIDKVKEKSDKIKAQVGDMYKKLPYENNFFDLVCSFQAINHNILDKILDLLKEIKRITKIGGIVAIKTADMDRRYDQVKDNIYEDKFGKKVKFIDEQTYIPLEGDEEGLTHYLFYQEQFTKEMEKIGFKFLEGRKSGGHFISIFRKH